MTETAPKSLPAIPIKHADFYIGMEFLTETGTWRCTDIGTRTIVAIKISDHEDPSWFNGPPYAVQEHVFDENDFDVRQEALARFQAKRKSWKTDRFNARDILDARHEGHSATGSFCKPPHMTYSGTRSA